MANRYETPDPKCRHTRRGIVTSGGPGEPHAAASVCDRPSCIEDAIEWARAQTHLPAEFVPDRSKVGS